MLKSLDFEVESVYENGESASEHLGLTPEQKQRILSDDRVVVHASKGDSYSPSDFRVVTTKPEGEPIGAGFLDEKTGRWSVVYGNIWVGQYDNWDDALVNLLVAYYG